jgi:hypothetical protein
MSVVGGITRLRINGIPYLLKSPLDYSLGLPMAEAVLGQDQPHGWTEKPQMSYIEATITDDGTVDVALLATTEGATVTGELNNGKVVMLEQAKQVGDCKTNSEAGEITVRFESALPGVEY